MVELQLKKLRKESNLSQAEMAKILNLSTRGYQDMEYGTHQANYDRLAMIADYFGCSIDYLLGHQTNNIIHLDSFTSKEKVAISLMKELDDDQLTLLLGYLARMTNTSLDEVQRKIEEK